MQLSLRRLHFCPPFPARTGLPKARQVVQPESIREAQILSELSLRAWSLHRWLRLCPLLYTRRVSLSLVHSLPGDPGGTTPEGLRPSSPPRKDGNVHTQTQVCLRIQPALIFVICYLTVAMKLTPPGYGYTFQTRWSFRRTVRNLFFWIRSIAVSAQNQASIPPNAMSESQWASL